MAEKVDIEALRHRVTEIETNVAVRDERHKAVILRLDNMDKSLGAIKLSILEANRERRIVGRGLLMAVSVAFIVAGVAWVVGGGLSTDPANPPRQKILLGP